MTTLTLACTGHSAWQDNADQAQRITISLVNALKRHTKAAAPVLALIVIEIALRCGFVLEGFDEAQYRLQQFIDLGVTLAAVAAARG